MKERPILFNGAMVRAILAGQKTQTRRAVKVQPPEHVHALRQSAVDAAEWIDRDGTKVGARCPFGVVGDRLWVREAFAVPPGSTEQAEAVYRASFDPGDVTWTPSIHMPRWASRLSLTITDVRAQRLQDITDLDAVAEGFDDRALFACTWVNIYGPKSWLTNPWVWAITFERGAP